MTGSGSLYPSLIIWIKPKSPNLFCSKLSWNVLSTAKPRDPDEYEFKDDQLAKDYRKMYEKYQQMEAMMREQALAVQEDGGD